jgi:hypothetical protein
LTPGQNLSSCLEREQQFQIHRYYIVPWKFLNRIYSDILGLLNSGKITAMKFRIPYYLTPIFIISFLLSGCSSLFPTQPVFVPPTLAATSRAIQTPLPTTLPATPTPSCINNLAYISDLTLPDGTFVNPGESLDKRWQVENTGTCNWEEGYTLRLITGPEMGGVPEHHLYPARAGTEAVIRIIYTAPAEPGIYRSAWQAYDPNGQAFGDPIFIEIIVP